MKIVYSGLDSLPLAQDFTNPQIVPAIGDTVLVAGERYVVTDREWIMGSGDSTVLIINVGKL